MLNFSNHHSLKARFQDVLGVLASAQTEQSLSQLIDRVISDRHLSNSLAVQSSSLESEAIILGLYYHQDLSGLNANFTDPKYLVIALAIAFSCRRELQPHSLISKVCSYLTSYSESYPDFGDQLRLANSLADQGASRAIATSVIAQDSLAFGLYCFVSTPYTWSLVNQGAGKFQISISAIAAAYLGYVPNNLGIKLGDRLLAAWAGVYDLTNIPSNFYPSIQFSERMSSGA